METVKSKKAVPPFFANTPDDTHCYQAVMKGILKFYLPDRNFSWKELEKMSGKLPSKATWPQQMLVNLHKMDFDIVSVSAFDGNEFISRGADYLLDAFGKETADWQVKNSDIAREQQAYREAYDQGVRYEIRIPELAEVRKFLKRGYLIECLVNSRKLNDKQGYAGHFVLIYDIDGRFVTFHDPGLPGRASRLAPLSEFEAAWTSPNEKAKGFTAFKYTGTTL